LNSNTEENKTIYIVTDWVHEQFVFKSRQNLGCDCMPQNRFPSKPHGNSSQ